MHNLRGAGLPVQPLQVNVTPNGKVVKKTVRKDDEGKCLSVKVLLFCLIIALLVPLLLISLTPKR